MDIIVGGGKFGLKVVEYMLNKNRDFIVLDPNENCEVAKKFKDKFVKAEAKELTKFVEKLKPEWIFPTAPIHVAAEAFKNQFKTWNEKINEIIAGFPMKVVVSIGKGNLVVSYNRDKLCISNCNSPDFCPVTKIKRPCPMFELVNFACPEAKVLISHQLSPGIGAIKGEDFIEVIKDSKKMEKIVIATACRCHGVLTALIKP
ncbi:MAG: hypothetical protein RMH75_05815 [Archaeoglobaceae archaeon]|nr:NAD-binding protein [Archaeoglobaceae archaeon]MDW7990161.1 hypothetical protein [Archaeoglobaceae archaeon]